jgi:hypothetical protein
VVIQRVFFVKLFDQRLYASLFPIVGGVALATYTESEFEWTGFVSALVASVLTGRSLQWFAVSKFAKPAALLAIVSGIVLSNDINSLMLMYYMAPISFFLLLPASFFLEGNLN